MLSPKAGTLSLSKAGRHVNLCHHYSILDSAYFPQPGTLSAFSAVMLLVGHSNCKNLLRRQFPEVVNWSFDDSLVQECPTYGPRPTIWPARRFYVAREVSIIFSKITFVFYRALFVVNICCRNVKNDRFVFIGCVFTSSKNMPKLVFCQGPAQDPAGELTTLPQTS